MEMGQRPSVALVKEAFPSYFRDEPVCRLFPLTQAHDHSLNLGINHA